MKVYIVYCHEDSCDRYTGGDTFEIVGVYEDQAKAKIAEEAHKKVVHAHSFYVSREDHNVL